MAVVRRELPGVALGTRDDERKSGHWPRLLLSSLLATIGVVLAYQLLTGVVFWAQVKIDDLRYGYPRTSQVEGYVGWGESNGIPSHVSVLNLHGQVVVLTMPGDDPTHVSVFKGPFLFGSNGQYEPVAVRLTDVTGDGYPDIIVSAAHQYTIWVNQPGAHTFHAPTQRERMEASKLLGGPII